MKILIKITKEKAIRSVDKIIKKDKCWMMIAERSLKKLWDNKEDNKIWIKYLKF